jgi:predicted small integral membrane protein
MKQHRQHLYELTPEDRNTWNRWAIGAAMFYGGIVLILVSVSIAQDGRSRSHVLIADKPEAATRAADANIAAAQP